MKKVASTELMRRSDMYTIENFVSARELMRRVGEAIFRDLPKVGRYGVVCGGGNNGGDGFAAALLLKQAGADVTVFSLAPPRTPECRAFFDDCTGAGVRILPFTGKLESFGVIVDCIFGTGFHGEPEGLYADAIDAINTTGAYVVSADINSGLCSESGTRVRCVVSDLTVAIGEYKPGHFLGCAKDVIKSLSVADIGIKLCGEPFYLLEAQDFLPVFPPRINDSHKGTYGTSAVFGGCLQYSGAAKLANLSLSALKAGCGISRLIVPEGIAAAVAPYLLESTLCTVPGQSSAKFDPPAIDKALDGVCSLAVGMGWGRGAENEKILSYILDNYKGALVIDADGLFALSHLKDYKTNGKTVLTPHPAEFSRLCGIEVSEILSNPISRAREYAASHSVTVLLKGCCTIVTDGERVYLVDRGCPGMATAGSGDVLSGIIAGVNAQNPRDITLNAAAGAWIAGVAGEFAQAAVNPVSMTASDTVAHIHEATAEITRR